MAGNKHQYIIHINGGSKQNALIYQYGRVKGISLRIGKQKATIAFETGSNMSAAELTSFKSHLFRDAYRKVYLLHALMKNEGLDVKEIEIFIDGDSYSYNQKDPHFPFMFSMIDIKPLGLSKSWSDLIPAILMTPKSEMDKDFRFVSAFSFLASKSKQYTIERFTNLWTSMNAYYSYIASLYEKELKSELGMVDDNEPLKNRDLKLMKVDGRSIGALCWLLYPKYMYPKNAEELWKHNYKTEKILSEYSPSQIHDLYEACLSETRGVELPARYNDLAECAELFGVPLYTYLLLINAYHWRCNLFHGNRATMLFSAYNDYDISVLHTINYFLDEFLNDAIPKMFHNDFFAGDYEKVKQYMREISTKQSGENEFDKQFRKEKKKYENAN